ncbi:MAG: hypothetical protein CM1200mP35_04020 [Chloroflexota bacterium]|nr:MAG: hypothetical protein CM1200mP35_04020 [Chloroflexota bacterium]
MDSLVSRDTIKANQVLKDDDEVDLLYDQVTENSCFYAPKILKLFSVQLTCSGQLMIWNESLTELQHSRTCHLSGYRKMVESNKSTE